MKYNSTEQAGVGGFAPFAIATGISFTLLAAVLVVVDFVPEPRVEASQSDVQAAIGQTVTPAIDEALDVTTVVSERSPTVTVTKSVVPVLHESLVPVRITINSIELDTPILAPESTQIDVLDRALLSGAVHYPGSGLAGQDGNMLIFGHSSYLPVVQNQAYKAFNELSKLKVGDVVHIYTSTHRYEYHVQDLWLANAEDTQVAFDAVEPTLTLATCNNFGAKQERWIATATLVSKESRMQ